MKDIKNIIILVLLAGFLLFGYLWFFRDTTDYKAKIKQLEKEKQELIETRDSLDAVAINLGKKYAILVQKEAVLLADIAKKEAEIRKSKEAAARSQAELNRLKNSLKETQRKIEELKKNPANRESDDLLNSLKLKTQR
jgi:Tfp pilus assembly protein PilO